MGRYIRIEGTLTLRSPLSHIERSDGIVAHFCRAPILQPDGEVAEVASYAGNAWRGQLRDEAAAYMLDALGAARVPLDTYHLLFSGGKLDRDGGSADIARRRRYREAIPMLALWGGGVGDSILDGKMRVGIMYPVCREAIPVLPASLRAAAEQIDHAALIHRKAYSRKDDGKDISLSTAYLTAPETALLPGEGGEPAAKGKAPAKAPQATQMRYQVELLAAGARLASRIDLLDVSEVELGCLVSALHRWSRSPHIGGMAAKGHGLCDLAYTWQDLDSGEAGDLLAVSDGACLMAPRAAEAKDAYDAHLREQYDAYLAGRAGEITALLGGKAA